MSKIHKNKRLQTFIIRLSQIFVVILCIEIKEKAMKTEITTQKQVSRKNLSIWLNSTEISLINLAVWLIYVKLSEKNLVISKKCCIFVS